ncbi:N-carbamoylputrescine amidase [gamma proteobacterium HTCC5015]|nr:N-carbamoylputrescine amidase [gamma proteobacterium HTCC5015]
MLAYLEAELRLAAADGAKLVVFQELHNTPYFCCELDPAHFDLAEPIPGPSTQFLGALAKELNLVIVASLFERRAAGLFHNTAVVLDQRGNIAGRFRKMHIPHDPGFEEKYYFTPGDAREDGFEPIAIEIDGRPIKLGLLVCWDQWYPEAARIMALKGADLLIYPTAIGWDPEDTQSEQQRQLHAWLTIQRSHAVANGLPVVSANRVGFERGGKATTAGTQFWGHSFICDSLGQDLAIAAHQDEARLIGDIDLDASERDRRIWPFLRDRRVDAYDDILKRFND